MGLGAAHTFKRRPVELIYAETHTRLAAIRRERQLKLGQKERRKHWSGETSSSYGT